jgi:hypothetical protein
MSWDRPERLWQQSALGRRLGERQEGGHDPTLLATRSCPPRLSWGRFSLGAAGWAANALYESQTTMAATIPPAIDITQPQILIFRIVHSVLT